MSIKNTTGAQKLKLYDLCTRMLHKGAAQTAEFIYRYVDREGPELKGLGNRHFVVYKTELLNQYLTGKTEEKDETS